jgi:hypothetical protein
MKTAMQEWFDELKANYPYMANEIYKKGFEKYLEKEKEQIIEAFEYGQINVNEDGCLSTEDGAQEYYDEKYTKYKKLPKDVKDWLNKL